MNAKILKTLFAPAGAKMPRSKMSQNKTFRRSREQLDGKEKKIIQIVRTILGKIKFIPYNEGAFC